MHVAVTGSSGLIGTALVDALRASGETVTRLVRSDDDAAPDTARWDPAAGRIDVAALEGVNAVVHLAGVGIADARWSDDHKRAVMDSRVQGTTTLAEALARVDGGPKVLLSGSAIGWYGPTPDDVAVDETATRGKGFLADVCEAWEEAAAPAVDAGLRVVYLRTGVVQSPDGGALARQLLPFRLGLGGKLGSGRQWVSWVTLIEEVAAIRWLIDHDVAGPVNLTAPEPVRNAELTEALGRVLGRPTLLTVPPFALKAILGAEAAESLALSSQRVVPGVLSEHGYPFVHPDIETGLRAELA